MTVELEIVVPVYTGAATSCGRLLALAQSVTTPVRVLICYDEPADHTLPAIQEIRRPMPACWSSWCATPRAVLMPR